MKKIRLLISLVAGCLLTGCEKEVTGIKLPESSSKLVVAGFISPQDTAVFVQVSRSEPSLGYQQPLGESITNASVSISDGTQTRPLTYSDFTRGYLVDTRYFPIAAGITYTLRVSVPGGEVAEAACTVPEAPANAPSVTIDSVPGGNNGLGEYLIRMEWTDMGGREDYYRPMSEMRVKVNSSPADTTAIFIDGDPIRWEGEVFLDDRGKDGERLFSPRGTMPMGYPDFKIDGTVSLSAHLLRTDRHYYLYHRSVKEALRSQDNPFAEPVLVYSNVTGGLGIFAATNRTTTVVQLR